VIGVLLLARRWRSTGKIFNGHVDFGIILNPLSSFTAARDSFAERTSGKSIRDSIPPSYAEQMELERARPAQQEEEELAHQEAFIMEKVENSVYKGIIFTKRLTEKATGQAILMEARQGLWLRTLDSLGLPSPGGTRNVAVKVLYLKKDLDEEQKRKHEKAFKDEIQFNMDIKWAGGHRNVLELLCSQQVPWPIQIFPLVETSLSQWLLNNGVKLAKIDFRDQHLNLVKGIAEGLAFIHAASIAHLDIKTENILVDVHDVPKIIDFGLSEKSAGKNVVKKQGTPLWMAPECFSVYCCQDTRFVDVWAFGMLIVPLLTGNAPFAALFDPTRSQAENHAKIVSRIRGGPRPQGKNLFEPSGDLLGKAFKHNIPLIKIMQACCARGAHDRPTMDKVVKLLEDLRWDSQN
jgi:serine/threonine protein kinase